MIRNVLPLYRQERVGVTSSDYAGHIERMLAAFNSDSKVKRDKLVAEARETAFVMSIAAADGRAVRTKPGDTYIATERLKELLSGVKDAYIVDERHTCLRGQDARDFLEACGATRHLRLVAAPDIGWDARAVLREKAGHAESSGQNDRVTDLTLFGLKAILQKLERLDPEARRHQAELLWEELNLIEERRGKGVFVSEYSWTHYGSYRTNFEATFVRTLNETPWVPGAEAELCVPGLVPFEVLGWRANPFLVSQIRFKPPIIEQLAKEAGFEPGVLDLLKKLGVTSEAELRARLRIPEASRAPVKPPAGQTSPEADLKSESEGNEQDTPGDGSEAVGQDDQKQLQASSGKPVPMSGQQAPATAGRSVPSQSPQQGGPPEATGEDAGSDREKDAVPRPFISFLGVHHDDEWEEPDGLAHEARMTLEELAITFILSEEPSWRRTPGGNPGFDLFKADDGGTPIEWCEVKAMTGCLDDHPVGISRKQFCFAAEKGEKAWLYIVERAGTQTPGIVRIQDPVGKARTFTFDRGWRSVDAGSGNPG